MTKLNKDAFAMSAATTTFTATEQALRSTTK